MSASAKKAAVIIWKCDHINSSPNVLFLCSLFKNTAKEVTGSSGKESTSLYPRTILKVAEDPKSHTKVLFIKTFWHLWLVDKNLGSVSHGFILTS